MPASLPRRPPRRRRRTEIEEPIWRAVRDTWHKFWHGWHGEGSQGMKPLAKALVMFAVVVGCIYFGGDVIGLAVPVLICYGMYYLIWVSVIRPSGVPKAVRNIDDQVAGAIAAATDLAARRDDRGLESAGGSAPPAPVSRYARKVRERRIRAELARPGASGTGGQADA